MTSLTANVLIRYAVDVTDADSIRESVELILGNYSLIAYKAERQEVACATVNERRLQEEPLSDMITHDSAASGDLIAAGG